MQTKSPNDIHNYEQFKEAMLDTGFQMKMHFAMRTLMEMVESNPDYLQGDDERIAKYWKQYQEDPTTIKPGNPQ